MNMIYDERARVHSAPVAAWKSWFVIALTVASLGTVSFMELTKIARADHAFCPGGSGCVVADVEGFWNAAVYTGSHISANSDAEIGSNLTVGSVTIVTDTVSASNNVNINDSVRSGNSLTINGVSVLTDAVNAGNNLTVDRVSIQIATMNAGNNINVNNTDSRSNGYASGSSSTSNGNSMDGALSPVKESEWAVTQIPVLGLVVK